MARTQAKQFVVCIDNDGYITSLAKRKIYVVLREAEAENLRLLRVIDESGEDYLYPETLFCPIKLPVAIKRAILAANDYRLEHDPRFLRRIENARNSLRAGQGIKLEDIKPEQPNELKPAA